jgi:hypothetical protein
MNPERKRKGKLKAKKILDIEEAQYDRDPWHDYWYRRRVKNVRKGEQGMTYEEQRFRRLTNCRHKGWNDNPRRKKRWGGSQKTNQEKRQEDNFKDQEGEQ